MPPSFPTAYHRNAGRANAILSCYPSATTGIKTDGSYLGFRKFGPTNSFAIVAPSFGGTVSNVVPLGSKKQMTWIHTWGIIAAMENGLSWRNWTINEHPNHAMCSYGSPVEIYCSIAKMNPPALPGPASIRPSASIDLAPEAIRDRLFNSHLTSYRSAVRDRAGTRLLADPVNSSIVS